MKKGKKLYLQVLALCLVLALTGCSFSAAPPTVPSTQGTEPPGTEPSQNTQPTQNTEPASSIPIEWGADPLTAAFPAPPVQTVYKDVPFTDSDDPRVNTFIIIPHSPWGSNEQGETFMFQGSSFEEMRTYVQSLYAGDFGLYVFQKEDPQNQRLIYCGVREDGAYICVNYQWMDRELQDLTSEVMSTYTGYISVCRENDLPVQTSENLPWGEGKYQPLLPKPTVHYSNAGEGFLSDANANLYRFQIDSGNFMDALAYTQQLRDFGFDLCISECFSPYNGLLQFRSQNKEGWMVEVHCDPALVNYFAVRLLTPEHRETYNLWCADYLPEPDVDNWTGTVTSYTSPLNCDWLFQWEMDFAQAQAYALQLEAKGYKWNVKRIEDAQQQTFSFHAEGSGVDSYGNSHPFIITFTYENGKCTLTALQDWSDLFG